nr:LruC domain-containing protein [Bacteroides thetaiotaomicron]
MMKKTILLTSIIAIAIVSMLSSCVDSEKDLYDPSYQTANPMGDGFAAPDGFDWATTSNIKVTVEVNAPTNDEFYYVVELYDTNPIISSDARLLDKGVAKGNEPYTSEISIENTIKTLFVKEITPTGLATVRSAEITNGIANCNFKTTIPSVRSLAASTRSFTTITDPNPDDTSLFPLECPSGIEKFISVNDCVEGGSYEVTASTKIINLWKNNLKLYVTEDIKLSEQIYLSPGSCLYILPGKKVSMPKSQNNGQQNCMITIGTGATLTIDKTIQLDSNYKLYNLGTINTENLICANSSVFFNAGSVNIKDKLSAENASSTISNAGKIKVEKIKIQGDSHIINTGTMEVEEETEINCTGGSWINEGTWYTDEMKISAWNDYCYNKCKLIVTDELEIKEGHLIVDGGGYVQCKELYMNNAKIELGAKALFEITEKAEYGYQNKDRGFKGTGTEKALLIIKKAVAETLKPNLIHYSGNLQVICSEHPIEKIDDWNICWTITGGAEWGEEGKNTVSIPESECSDGYNGGTPTPPTNPEFPIEVEDNKNYTYLFEDQWPLYGDYDMNDIVLTIQKRKIYTNKENKVTKFELSIDLSAAGATKSIGAAIMLDNVPANAITQPVEFSDNTLAKNFNLNNNNIENGQDYTVIPLFDDAHKVLGRDRHEQINTVSDYAGNTKPKNISFSITFNNPTISADAFNVNKLNVFIIVDGNRNPRKEIHVAGYQPTKLANIDLFGGNNDNSHHASKKYYISKENLAWGIMVPSNFKWPLEYVNIKTAYSQFSDWVTSGGTENEKWWNDFDVNKVFQTNKN